eukprot:gene10008-11071_t
MSDNVPAAERPSSAGNETAVVQPSVDIILRPMVDGWTMGEDWEVTRPLASTFVELKEFIEEERGINRNRIQIRLRGKIIVPNREKWTLRRMGIAAGFILLIEPTLLGSWWWNPISHYQEQLLQQVEVIIDERGGGLFYSELVEVLQPPPPIKVSLRVFLRSFPERIHVYTDIVRGTMWIERAVGVLQTPTFATVPHSLGYFKHNLRSIPLSIDQDEGMEDLPIENIDITAGEVDALGDEEKDVEAEEATEEEKDEEESSEVIDQLSQDDKLQPTIEKETEKVNSQVVERQLSPEEMELHVAMHGGITDK